MATRTLRLSILLLTLLSMGGCVRKPWSADCFLVISELRSQLHIKGTNNQEYVELERVCAPNVRRQTVDISHEFKLIQIRLKTKQVVRFCHVFGNLHYVGSKPANPLIVIGNDETTNVKIRFNSPQCITSDETSLGYTDTSETHAIVLLHHKGSQSWFDSLMPRAVPGRTSPIPASVDRYNEPKISIHTQDMLIFGLWKPDAMPPVLNAIQSEYTDSSQWFLHVSPDFGPTFTSFSRCATTHGVFQAGTFRATRATPGQPNACNEGVPVFQADGETEILAKRPRTAYETSTQSLPTDQPVLSQISTTESPPTPPWILEIQSRHKANIDINKVTAVKDWFEYLRSPIASKDAYRCKKCHHVLKEGIVKEREHSSIRDKLMSEEGVNIDTPKPGHSKSPRGINNDMIFDHEQNVIHKIAEDYFRISTQVENDESIRQEMMKPDSRFRRFYFATENLFRVVIEAVQIHIPFNSFPKLTGLLTYFKASIGNLYQNKNGMANIVKSIGDSMHSQLISFLKAKDLELSIAVDSSTDISVEDHLTVELQLVDTDFRVYSFLYRYVKIGVDKRGVALMEKLKEAFIRDDLLSYMKKNIVSASFDSAPVMINTFYEAMQKFTDHKVMPVPCYAHRSQTVLRHVFEKNEMIGIIDKTINSVYAFYHKSAKCTSHLRHTTQEEDDTGFQLHRLYKIRWVGGRVRSMHTLLLHHRVLALDLQSIPNDPEIDSGKYSLATEMYKNITDRTFLTYLAFVSDVSEIFTHLTNEYQTKCITLVGQSNRHEQLLKEIDALAEKNGPNLQHLIESSKCNGVSCTLESFESSTTVTFDTVPLGSSIKIDKAPPPSLSSKKIELINKIKQEFTDLFQEQIYKDVDIFDPAQLENFAMKENVENKIIRLNRWFLWVPHANNDRSHVNQLILEYVNLISSVIQHPKYLERKNKKAHNFWFLFAGDSTIRWSETVKRMIRFLLSLSASIAQCERNFSLWNKEKVKSRASLKAETVESLVRIRKNFNKVITDEEYIYYAKEFCGKHSRADDITRAGAGALALEREVEGEGEDAEKVVPFRALPF